MHHDHIVCMDCGVVEEFVDPEIETRQNSIAQAARLQDRRAFAGAVRPLPAPRLSVAQAGTHPIAELTVLRRRRAGRRRAPYGCAVRGLGLRGQHLQGMRARALSDLHAAEHARELLHPLLAG